MFLFPTENNNKQSTLLEETLRKHSYAIFDVSNYLDCLDDHQRLLFLTWNETFATAFRQTEDTKLASSKFRMERGISVGYKIEDRRQFMETRFVDHGKSIEPDFPDVSEYTETVRLLFTMCRILGKRVLSTLAKSIGLDPQSLLSLTDLNEGEEVVNDASVSTEGIVAHPPSPPELSSSLLRICMYPVVEETTSNNDSLISEQTSDRIDRTQSRVESAFGAHTDTSFLTIGLCSTQPGLEMLNATTGEWIPVEQQLLKQPQQPQPTQSKSPLFAVVFLGDCLQALTGGYYRAAPHRVNFRCTKHPSYIVSYLIILISYCTGNDAGVGFSGICLDAGAGIEDGVSVLPRVSCPFIIRGRHDAVINLRYTHVYHHTRPDILLPADDDQEDDSVDGQEDRAAEKVATVPDGCDADVDGVVSKSDPDHLRGLRLPNVDGSSMKFLHQVIIFYFSVDS